MKKFSVILLMLMSLSVINSGCSKYDENSGITLASKQKRISQIWKIDGFVLADGTSKAPGEEEGYVEFTKEGDVVSHYTNGTTSVGKWSFFNKKKQIYWSNEYVTDIEEVVHFDESKILKLTKKEFWLQESGGGIITKFSLK